MDANRSQLAETALGPLEFAIHGQGFPVLLAHGTGGGVDQGLMLARLLDSGFMGIAVSRAGYLRTPSATAPTPVHMADAYASLLDHLRIDKAAILGLSAGGMSSALFALRHPERCSALVLADAITQPPPAKSVKTVKSISTLPDPVAWLVTRLGVHVIVPLMTRDKEAREMLRVFFENNPISERYDGVMNDLQLSAFEPPDWSGIRIPALVVHGERDALIPTEHGRAMANSIPGAEFLLVPGGGHECLVSHHHITRPILNTFLKKATSATRP